MPPGIGSANSHRQNERDDVNKEEESDREEEIEIPKVWPYTPSQN